MKNLPYFILAISTILILSCNDDQPLEVSNPLDTDSEVLDVAFDLHLTQQLTFVTSFRTIPNATDTEPSDFPSMPRKTPNS